MNSFLKFLLVVGLPIIISLTVFYFFITDSMLAGLLIGISIGGVFVLLVGFPFSKSGKKLFADAEEEYTDKEMLAFIKANKGKIISELIIAIIFLVGTFLFFMHIYKRYLIDFTEGMTILIILFYIFFSYGVVHILGSNIISYGYNIGNRLFPYNYIPLSTPKRSKIFGATLLSISFMVLVGLLFI